ncbi:MAG: UPF0280 family protein [bacterium]
MYEERKYREWVRNDELITFRVTDEETDILVSGVIDLSMQAKNSVSKYRKQIKDYIRRCKHFLTTLEPTEVYDDSPQIIKEMASAAKVAGVGPMAAVAGALAEYVGYDLLKFSDQIIIENGGDIFMKITSKKLMGIYAGNSRFTGKIGIQIEPEQTPLGICTSSGTVGHSLSFGKADAAVILSKKTALADAVATATGNIVKTEDDIHKGIDFAKSINGIEGVIIIIGSKMGIWGNVKIAKTMNM